MLIFSFRNERLKQQYTVTLLSRNFKSKQANVVYAPISINTVESQTACTIDIALEK